MIRASAEAPDESLGDERIDGALRGRDHLCFGHDWSGDPLSKTHLMRAMAREGRVLWINSIGYRAPAPTARDLRRIAGKLKAFTLPVREVEPNLWVLSPLAVPFYTLPSVQRLNRWLLRVQIRRAFEQLGFRRVIDWVFTPTAAVVAGALGEAKVIYYCVDDFTAFADAGTPALVEMEAGLLRRADLVVVSARPLLESKSRYNRKTVLLRHGVQYDTFRSALDPATRVPDDVAGLPRPILGYFGLMTDEFVDRALLEKIARRFPAASLVLIGNAAMDLKALAASANVHVLGHRPFHQLPAYCKAFDVALSVFPINAATLNANPLKVREYLAAGLPVVSTKIPEVEVLGDLVRVAGDHEQFLAHVEEALRDPGPTEARSLRMRNESWDVRYLELKRHLVRYGIADAVPPS